MADSNFPRQAVRSTAQPATGRALPDVRLLGFLAQLAAASTTAEIADTAVSHAVALLGGRAGALGLLSAGNSRVDIAGSVGYGCGMMSAGSSLSVDADLPITRAATTGTTVVAGDIWIAAPLAPAPAALGALLVSLAAPSQHPHDDAALVEEIAAYARAALARLPRRLPAPPVIHQQLGAAGVAVDVRRQPRTDACGGDIVELWPASDGSCWLLVADACGADAVAGTTAFALAVAARAVSSSVGGPAELLIALDRALTATAGARRFVTAVVARLRPSPAGLVVTMATAGHPAPCLVSAGGACETSLLTESPLNLRLGRVLAPVEKTLTVGPDDRLLFYTDGALDRTGGSLPNGVLTDILTQLRPRESLLDEISEALAAAGGPTRDDMALALVRATP